MSAALDAVVAHLNSGMSEMGQPGSSGDFGDRPSRSIPAGGAESARTA